ncbi:hypothetical protein ML462_15805 [Gramella lutea]|uniref:Uncharacterized protein n=1 Tax=Christiangramia lutea TaxID=1607951 RepID=A0A9X1V7V5_9FLAO|nr:hypothetical protein [Christiangramia lutea]MCH4824639.1 hypothetical protein [Christiangramia lutea]
MKKNRLLFYFMILTFICGYGQKNDSYELTLYNSKIDKKYKIDYRKTDKKTFLVVNKETSIQKFSKADSLKLFRLIKIETPEAKKEFSRIIESYKEYKSDTLLIKSKDLENRIDDFVENWNNLKEDLEKNPDQRLILDGYMIKLSLEKEHKNYEEIYAQTPTKKSHPKIFDLISDLETFYKKESKNPVID